MATPRRQPRPATESEAIRAKLATYSFAQQLPRFSSHAPPPPPHNPQTKTPDDPNFPKLTSKPAHTHTNRITQNLPRAWESAKRPTTPGRPPRWANGPGKPATAAEVVAAPPADASAQGDDAAESEKQEAEFALYSKLVPTTSAVPRNPGSLLGGGGLRATGSIAVQKSSRSTAGTPLHTPQPLPLPPRKEPMVSRMRNLSSEASKPQLARRVARVNRSASATPPPATSVPSSASSNASVDGMESETTMDEELEKVVAMAAISRKDDHSHLSNRSREGSPYNSTGQSLKLVTRRFHGDYHEAKVAPVPSRRLDEAFRGRNRLDASVGTPNGTKQSLHGSRRSSPRSPPPGLRKSSVKDGLGRSSNWVSKETPANNVPPGFESRSSAKSSFGRSRNTRPEQDSTHPLKQFDRGNPPIRPQNARADALREALNSRRRPASPRVLRNSKMQMESTYEGNGHASMSRTTSRTAVRTHSERETVRTRTVEDDPNRRAQSASSDEFDAALNDLRASCNRRSSAGNLGRRPESPNGSADFVIPAAGTQGRERSSFADLGAEQRRVPRNFPAQPKLSSEPKGFTNSMTNMSAYTPKEVTANGVDQMHSGSSGNVSPAVMETDVHYPTGQFNEGRTKPNSNTLRNDWRGTINKASVGDRESQSFPGSLFENGTGSGRALQGQSSGNRGQNVSSPELSMFDVVNEFHANGGETVLKNHPEGMDDVVQPPLPNSEDVVGFESMLRSMGWTPPDEEEGP